MTEGAFLLDTCALLFIATGKALVPETEQLLEKASATNSILVSPISAWELGKLVARGRLHLTTGPLRLFEDFLSRQGTTLCDVTPEILIGASFLPEMKHKDPMDQILISTARTLNVPLVTSDQIILNYGREGHVKTIAC